MPDCKVVVLGAGASRAVSYAREASIPSPLDRDYFDLLQRFDHQVKDDGTIAQVVKWAEELPFEQWRSMEQCFYTLQSRSHLAGKLGIKNVYPTDAEIVTSFVNATGALLRAAHGTRSCEHHVSLIENLAAADTILTFNYDLVTERAFKEIPNINSMPFGPWLYGLDHCSSPFVVSSSSRARRSDMSCTSTARTRTSRIVHVVQASDGLAADGS
jgi:hypothetical protein